VVDSRAADDGTSIRRRRQCDECATRFTTFERLEEVAPVVVKRRAVVTLSFFKYRDTSIGPYHEVGLAVLAAPTGQPAQLRTLGDLMEQPRQTSGVGFFVLDLPVSTPLACAAGRDIWGFPKFVTQLPIELEGNELAAEVLDPGGTPLMSLAGQLGYGADAPLPGSDLAAFSLLPVPCPRRRNIATANRPVPASHGRPPPRAGLGICDPQGRANHGTLPVASPRRPARFYGLNRLARSWEGPTRHNDCRTAQRIGHPVVDRATHPGCGCVEGESW